MLMAANPADAGESTRSEGFQRILDRFVNRATRERTALSNAREAGGQVLGGTTVAGATINPVRGDFTRNNGNSRIARVSARQVGTTADGKVRVRVSARNLSSSGGTFATPVWFGAHDGSFDVYNRGEAAPEFLERVAEDGTTDAITEAFNTTAPTGVQGVLTGGSGADGPLDPGETASTIIELDPSNRFFSFASMVIPSNDAFISSPGDQLAIELFNEQGEFQGFNSVIRGRDVLDAGTEVNNEREAAFLNQTALNTGDVENGTVELHPGFLGSQGLSRA